jgi:hypothetical protein
MRVLVLALILAASGCILEAIGAYTCDSYCDGISDKVATCAANEGLTWDEFAGGSRSEVLDRCQTEIDGRNLSDIQCQGETVVINNASCEDIVDTVQAYL